MKKTLPCVALLVSLNTLAYAATPSSKAADTTPSPTANQSNMATIVEQSEKGTPQQTQAINCNYHISADTALVDSSIITKWAENATLRAFDYNDTNIDAQLGALKPCFTDQGWQGFNEALLQSGNIDAIKSQHLSVSAQINGRVAIDASKENQWKVTMPLQVVYQNDKQRLTQQLIISILIGRQTSGDLGILQMIASPQQPTPASKAPETPGQ